MVLEENCSTLSDTFCVHFIIFFPETVVSGSLAILSDQDLSAGGWEGKNHVKVYCPGLLL